MIPETSRDGAHPNGVGYKVMADVLCPYLEEAFGKR
jgi:lysophospholipase L1-like esterase